MMVLLRHSNYLQYQNLSFNGRVPVQKIDFLQKFKYDIPKIEIEIHKPMYGFIGPAADYDSFVSFLRSEEQLYFYELPFDSEHQEFMNYLRNNYEDFYLTIKLIDLHMEYFFNASFWVGTKYGFYLH